MKHGKKPTVAQKVVLQQAGMDWREWLVMINLPNTMIVIHRQSNETRVIDRNEKGPLTEMGRKQNRGGTT